MKGNFNVDIVRFKGGLGNQMFQYALVEALRARGREVGCNFGFYRKNTNLRGFELDKVFNGVDINEVSDDIFCEIDERWNKIKENSEKLERFKNDTENRFFYVEEKSYVYDKKIFQTKDCTFVGYWQTERYFRNIRSVILKRFQFDISDNILKQLGDKYSQEYVSIHIRRDDYLQNERYQVIDIDYYKEAIKMMKMKFQTTKFIVFTDDLVWAKENLTLEGVEFFDASVFAVYENWYDMYLMTRCKGNIIANSSFSWWGAWLNTNQDKVVIAPKRWIKGEKTSDIWCENWIKI